MLLELCDMTLKDWLTDNKAITDDDVLEDISIFGLDVARAVEFLHSQHVRLASAFSTARRHNSAVYAVVMCLSLCLSVVIPKLQANGIFVYLCTS